ncbi:histone-lysine N-methyltransferase SETDB1 [Nephila pilipes]|uniref:Histone-lysine N-methyltransferase SETDB1 n=1 Tax=Nephila pilipes TaxID=299642 RepID=A0A8X6N4S0_NEPPI|nr:histone-lysine N-methyltransferase SETDB1 [Nephila pilipes]
MESLTPKITCAVHEKTMPSTIPTIYSVDSNCEKDVNEVTLTNHNSNSSEGNSVKDDSSSLKRKLSDEVPKLEEMLKKCKAQYSNQEKVKENFERTSELAQIMDDLFRRSQICIRGLRDFINTKGFLFMTPLSDLKSHPLFQNLDTTFGDGIDTTLIRAPKVLCTSSEKDLTNDGLEVLKVLSRSKPNLPSGCIKRKDLLPGSEVWVMKTNLVDVFVEGTVLSICDVKPEKLFKVRFNETNTIAPKLYTAKQLAYRINSDIIAPVGTRIIARYSDGIKPKLYAGIVAEPPKTTNLERYLIFFDDGYAQYIEHKDIYVMCAQSIDVADDVHKNICKFIKTYLQKYPERPMLKLQKDQITKTEYDREWWDTKVMDVDASMVKMYFIASNRTEWIYRGSTRLKPLYDELESTVFVDIPNGYKLPIKY